MPRNVSDSPRAHGRSQGNTCLVTFRFAEWHITMLVHGRRTEVDHRIRTAVQKNRKAIDFWDLKTNKNVVIDLEEAETWTVKEAR